MKFRGFFAHTYTHTPGTATSEDLRSNIRKMCGSMCFHVHLNEAKGSQPTPAEACSTWRENERGKESESRRVLRHVTHAKIDFNKATTLHGYYSIC